MADPTGNALSPSTAPQHRKPRAPLTGAHSHASDRVKTYQCTLYGACNTPTWKASGPRQAANNDDATMFLSAICAPTAVINFIARVSVPCNALDHTLPLYSAMGA